MSKKPIIFALANPDPEMLPSQAHAIRDDIVMATGRSDFDNQVNNVLGFPFLFKGALEAKAKQINNDMLIAAANALALLAKEPVPQSVLEAYGVAELNFGPNYIIPKPFDPRLIEWVAKAVKEAYKEDK
jgi:malate dehydrogenase (oxaloacetate-decarboxylating)(NADP+)